MKRILLPLLISLQVLNIYAQLPDSALVQAVQGVQAQETLQTHETLNLDTTSKTLNSDTVAAQQVTIASVPNTSSTFNTVSTTSTAQYRFKGRQLILPTLLIGVGVLGLTSDWMESKNHAIKDHLVGEAQEHRIRIDGITQYLPVATNYALKYFGVQGEHNTRDYRILSITSFALTTVVANTMKIVIGEERPDKDGNRSFPSGHTAIAFMGAEMLRREYRDVSPWIGVAGYAVAIGTGFLRVYNNRHWMTDVLGGAGVGILCAKASYWLFPYIRSKIYKKKDTSKCTTQLLSAY